MTNDVDDTRNSLRFSLISVVDVALCRYSFLSSMIIEQCRIGGVSRILYLGDR